ncbi:MAG TPA: hypothetical protein VGP47_00050, partial [Parachlamydiaceae bacterium]|nr:hypothetical protein [Parachlamydiaceae bacterium]
MGLNFIYDIWSQGASFAANPLIKVPHDILINSTAKIASPPYKIVDESIQEVTDLITGAYLGKKFFHHFVKDASIYTTPRNWVVNNIAARATNKLQDRVDKSLRVGFKSLFSDLIYQYAPLPLRLKVTAGMIGVQGVRIVGNSLVDAGNRALTEVPQIVANMQANSTSYLSAAQSTIGSWGNDIAETSAWKWTAWGAQGLAYGIGEATVYVTSTAPAQAVILKTQDVWDGIVLNAYGAQEALCDATYCTGKAMADTASSMATAVSDTSAAQAICSAGSQIISAAQTICDNAPNDDHGMNASGYMGEIAANAVVNVLNKQDPLTQRSTLDKMIENAARVELTKKVDGLFATIWGVASVFAVDGLVTCGQALIMNQVGIHLDTGLAPSTLQLAMLGVVQAGNIYKFAKSSGSLISMTLPKISYLGYRLSANLPDRIKLKVPGQKVFA